MNEKQIKNRIDELKQEKENDIIHIKELNEQILYSLNEIEKTNEHIRELENILK